MHPYAIEKLAEARSRELITAAERQRRARAAQRQMVLAGATEVAPERVIRRAMARWVVRRLAPDLLP